MRHTCFFIVLLCQAVTLPGRADEASEKFETRALMHQFAAQLTEVKPYLTSQKRFESSAGKQAVAEMLKVLTAKTDSEKIPTSIEQSLGFRTTFGLLADHIQRTQEVFSHGQYEYARMRLNGTTALCIACHTQTPDRRGLTKRDPSLEANSFENAEFLFITRKFDRAIAMESELIKNYPDNKLSLDELQQILSHQLAIFSRVLRNPKAGIESLKANLENKKLPKPVVEGIQEQIKALEEWKQDKPFSDQAKDEELFHYIEKQDIEPGSKRALSGAETVQLLRVSGLLYERMMKPNAKLAELLYALGLCEKNLNSIYWYSLSDVYWKKCVLAAPKTPIAKKCFNAYEQSMSARYRHSPPEFVRTSIELLRKEL